jgi:D-3-phosphoglycerate dehydrogenase
MAAEQVRNFFENGNIRNSVNFPATEMDRGHGARILISSRNIASIANQVNSILEHNDIKIDNMLSKNKNEISYSIIDAKIRDIAPEVIAKIKAIDGVFTARVLQGK